MAIQWDTQNSSGIKWDTDVTNTPEPTKTNSPLVDVIYSGLSAGKEALTNLPSSAVNMVKGTVSAVVHPIDTLSGLGKVGLGAVAKLIPGQQPEEENFNQFGKFLKDRYGSLENLQKTATEDPFGFGTDVLSLIEGGATLAGKSAEVSRALSKTAQMVTKPVTKTASVASDIANATTKFGVSQATGLNADTISEILKNPQKFKNINPELRVETAQKVADALDTRLSELSDMGKGYDTIRQAEGVVTIPPETIKNVLNKYGVKLDDSNRIVTSPESRPLSAGDRVALQDFIDNYGGVTTHTNNSFLNTREALSNLAKYDSTKTNISTNISRDLRSEYDKLGKAQIKGLNELDTAYAPERQLLGELKRDIFDAKGELKPTAISKIANITGKGKEQVLERVRQIVPDIEERVNVIKAVEDIERASGFKTGAYIRGAVTGGAVLTGNVPAIVASILSQPSIAVPLLKGAGYVGAKASPILEAVKAIASDINNFKLPAPIMDYAKNPKMGMSIEDISKTGKMSDMKIDLLNQEAKKYKSAEEFVKAQGETLYHGTISGNKFDTFDLSKAKTGVGGQGFGNMANQGDVAYFTVDKDAAKTISKVANETSYLRKNMGNIEANAKVSDQPYGEVLEFYSNAKIKNLNTSPTISDIKTLKEQGYDGVRFPDTKAWEGVVEGRFKYPKNDTTVAIWNTDKIKTKSQLIDIWKKANKK